MGEEEEFRRFPVLAWLQALILAAIIVGAGWAFGGTRLWANLPIYLGVGLLFSMQILRLLLCMRSQLLRFDLADGCAVLFLIYAGIRYLNAPVEFVARVEWLNIICCVVVLWVVRYGFTHASQGIFLLYVLALNGVALSIYALWLHYYPECALGGGEAVQNYAPRLVGPFGCPDHLGNYLLTALGPTLGLGLFTRGLVPVRFLLLGMAGLMILVIGLTFSIGCWLAIGFVVLAVTLFCIKHSSLRWFFPVTLFVTLLVVTLLAFWRLPFITEQFASLVQHFQQHTLDQHPRIQLLHDGLHMWQLHFWVGSGPASFGWLHPRYQNPQFPMHAGFVHNEWLNLLCDYGFIGGFLGCLFVLTIFVLLARPMDYRTPSVHRILLCAAVAAWAASMAEAWLDFSLHIPACVLALIAVTGLGLRKNQPAGLHLPHGHQQAIHFGFALILSGLLFSFVWLGWKSSQGYYPFWQAAGYSTKVDPASDPKVLGFNEAIPLLRKSVELDPQSPSAALLLGDIYAREAGRQKTFLEKWDLGLQSIHWYENAHSLNRLDDESVYKLGLTYLLLHRDVEAGYYFSYLTGLQPYNGYFWQAQAESLRRQGLVAQAVEAYEKAASSPYGNDQAGRLLPSIRLEIPQQVDPAKDLQTLP